MMCLGMLFYCNFCGEQGMCMKVSAGVHYYTYTWQQRYMV